MSFELRDVCGADLDAILRLNEAAVPAVNSIGREQAAWFAANAAYFRVAASSGRVGGFLIGLLPGLDYASPNYRWFCGQYDEFGYIDRVAVAADARRHGIASRLYADFEASLPAEVSLMACEVNLQPPNESSMRFHEKLGFRQVGSQLIDDGQKEVALLVRQR